MLGKRTDWRTSKEERARLQYVTICSEERKKGTRGWGSTVFLFCGGATVLVGKTTFFLFLQGFEWGEDRHEGPRRGKNRENVQIAVRGFPLVFYLALRLRQRHVGVTQMFSVTAFIVANGTLARLSAPPLPFWLTPLKRTPGAAPSTCSNGIPGVQDGAVCCLEACGQCGGTGCGAIAGTEGASDCCPSTIMENAAGEFCGDAPCIIEGITPAPTDVPGTPAPFGEMYNIIYVLE